MALPLILFRYLKLSAFLMVLNSIEILIGILLQFLGGLADLTKAIQVNDQMVEVNGHPIQGKSLNDVILLLQNRWAPFASDL